MKIDKIVDVISENVVEAINEFDGIYLVALHEIVMGSITDSELKEVFEPDLIFEIGKAVSYSICKNFDCDSSGKENIVDIDIKGIVKDRLSAFYD